jgi:hypothetical protein
MRRWLAEKFFGAVEVVDEDEDFADEYEDEDFAHDTATPCLEESVAYSSFLASGVAGIEEVGFEEFLRLMRSSRLRADTAFES